MTRVFSTFYLKLNLLSQKGETIGELMSQFNKPIKHSEKHSEQYVYIETN